ncbi:MAG: dihydroorotate dehydrogenase electron transfer subunit [Pseudomonadota bacterium]|nr:dihydroorotate dehydrogenase electron transfer subunit [Pseudomonadota bacterium]
MTTVSGRILASAGYPGGYQWLRLTADFARHVQPGQYLRLDGQPWPVLRAVPGTDQIECLKPDVPPPAADATVAVEGPLGAAFELNALHGGILALGDAPGLAPLVHLAQVLSRRRPPPVLLVLLASERPLPFRPRPSVILVPGLPAGAIATLPLLEDWGVACRLASGQSWPGCFDGSLETLARHWLDWRQRLAGAADATLLACGSAAVLAGARHLAGEYALDCQTVAGVEEE